MCEGGIILWQYCVLFVTLFIVTALKSQPITETPHLIVSAISRNSYGIYLFHSPMIYITYKYLSNSSPIVVVGLNLIFAVVAYLLTDMIRKTRIRMIIGE